MAQKEGRWYCDVCDAEIAAGQKRYPLDSGRIACADCWQDMHPPDAAAEMVALVEAEILRARVVAISGCIGALLGALAGCSGGGPLGAIPGVMVGAVMGMLFGFLVTIKRRL